MLGKIALLTLALVLAASAAAVEVEIVDQIPPKDLDFTDLISELSGENEPDPNAPPLYITPLAPTPTVGMIQMAEYAVRPMDHREESLELTEEVEDVLEQEWVVNINTAPTALLARVPLIGPLRAESIVSHRYANGSFGRISEIREVFGITDWHFLRLAPHLVCEGQTTYTIPSMVPEAAAATEDPTANPTTQPTVR